MPREAFSTHLGASLVATGSRTEDATVLDGASRDGLEVSWHRRCCRRCMRCCFDSVSWRSSPCDCCSTRFVKTMTLFEDRNVEAQYLQHSKTSRQASIVPPVMAALALVLVTIAFALSFAPFDWMLMVSPPIVVPVITTFAVVCATKCHTKLQYQLRAATFALALTTATIACGYLVFLLNSFAAIGPLGLLWVCQKALVISDVVAARVLVLVVPINMGVLLLGVADQVRYLISDLCDGYSAAPSAIARTTFELGTSVIACSGVLLWVALRNATASRSLFYWNRVVGSNVQSLDAEANPFHEQRLQDWLSRDQKAQEMVQLSHTQGSDSSREFWELDGVLLQLQRKVAAGTGGVVWQATYKGEPVAAKQLFSGQCTGPDQLHDLAAEVSVLAQLSHVNVVRFLGLCRHSDSGTDHTVYLPLFIVQEYCSSNLRVMLSDVLPSMALGEWQSEVCRVAMEIASAMAYLHSRKVLHRDLKPENVLLTQQSTVRVADFGVSVQYIDKHRSPESTGGTPAYMAPEWLCPSFFASSRAADEQADVEMFGDVYAYGVICCELLHSDSDAGIVGQLSDNAASNRRLSAAVRTTNRPIDLQHEWALPSFSDPVGLPLRGCLELGRRCCAFHPKQRISFAEVCNAWNDHLGHSELHKRSVVKPNARSWNQPAAGGNAASRTPDDGGNAGRALPVPAVSNSASSASRTDQHAQVALPQCWSSWWTKHHLRFADDDTERRFVSFLHSAEFFRYLRWPYTLLMTLHFGFTVVMFAIAQAHTALYPLTRTLLFGAAALFSWQHRLQKFSTITLVCIAALAALVQCATVWGEFMYFPTHYWDNFTSVNGSICVCEVSRSHSCPISCQFVLEEWGYVVVLLPLTQDLTTPVILMVLGLPVYLYVWLLALTVVSWMGTVACGLVLGLGGADTFSLVAFLTVVLPGLALFPICIISAVAGERTRRQLFLKLCLLRSQESDLLERASFRSYRDALAANWHFLSASRRTSSNSPSQPHVVTEATG